MLNQKQKISYLIIPEVILPSIDQNDELKTAF